MPYIGELENKNIKEASIRFAYETTSAKMAIGSGLRSIGAYFPEKLTTTGTATRWMCGQARAMQWN